MTPTIRVSCCCIRRHSALLALVAAGLLWGLTVPLSKLVLDWLDGGWLTVVRFALAAPLLAFAARKHLRAAFTPRILSAGAIGYGIVIVLQNAGIGRTSVSHAALIVGADAGARRAGRRSPSGRGSSGPAGLVRVRARARGRRDRRRWRRRRRRALGGDALVLLSVALSATFVVVQPSLLRRPRPVRGDRGADDRRRRSRRSRTRRSKASRTRPRARRRCWRCSRSGSPGRSGRSRSSPTGSRGSRPSWPGTFLNLEPLVGTAAGALAFGDPFGPAQLLGRRRDPRGHRAQHRPPGGSAPRTPGGDSRTARRRSAPSAGRRRGGSLPTCPQASTRSTSPTPPRPTASARAAEP